MATALETLKRKALRGVVREIQNLGDVSLISAEVEEESMLIASELPTEEITILNLRIGDAVNIYPINTDSYLIIGNPKQ